MATPPEIKNKKKWRIETLSISVTLAVAISVLVTVVGATLLLISMDAGRDSTHRMLQGMVVTLSSRLEDDLKNHMQRLENHLDQFSQRIALGEVSLDDQARINEISSGALSVLPSLLGMATSQDGVRFNGTMRLPNGSTVPHTFNTHTDGVITSTFPDDLLNAPAQWGEVTLTDGRAMVARHQPIVRQGQPIGSLMLAIEVSELSRRMAKIGQDVGGHGFILKGRDQILAHGMRSGEAKQNGSASLTIDRNILGDAVLASLWEGRTPPPIVRMGKEINAELRHVKVKDKHFLAVMRQVSGYGPTPWTVGAWFPGEALGQDAIKQFIWAGVIGVLVLIVGIGEAVILGRRIARPIEKATDTLNQVRTLELSDIQPMPKSFFRELNDQAAAFNTMLVGLRAFERYVPKRLVACLIREGNHSCAFETLTQTREVTIVFTDLAGFTTFSENMPPQEVAAFLNDHFALLGERVEAEGGTIDKFIGDALMAFWGAPVAMEDAPARACRAALAISDAWQALNDKRQAAGECPIPMRIGIHTGQVVVGNIGYTGRINYTIVGDAVNTCQRLESLGREVDDQAITTTLISQAVVDRLEPGAFKVRQIGTNVVKGRNEPITYYRLLEGAS